MSTAATKKFRIGLISPYSNLAAIGLRSISAALQAAGYATRLLFLPDPDELYYKAVPPRPSAWLAFPSEIFAKGAQDAAQPGLGS